MQDCAVSKSVVVTPRSGGSNVGATRTRCGPHILSYLRTKVRGLIIDIRILLHMHVFVCASMCEFQGRNYVKGGRM